MTGVLAILFRGKKAGLVYLRKFSFNKYTAGAFAAHVAFKALSQKIYIYIGDRLLIWVVDQV